MLDKRAHLGGFRIASTTRRNTCRKNARVKIPPRAKHRGRGDERHAQEGGTTQDPTPDATEDPRGGAKGEIPDPITPRRAAPETRGGGGAESGKGEEPSPERTWPLIAS
eukprot:11166103-Alexandrium_andersonii.AAC.1